MADPDTDSAQDRHPPSPCRALCVPVFGGEYCSGCWRSMEEIMAWPEASAAEKHAILARVAQRKAEAG